MKIVPVIVTYRPQVETLKQLISTLLGDTDDVVLVNNGAAGEVERLQGPGVHLLVLDRNRGIAAGQNQGVALALSLGADAVLLLDQDSRITQGFVPALAQGLRDPRVRIVAPVAFDAKQGFGYPIVDVDARGGRRKYRPEAMHRAIEVSTVISSGTLVQADVFEQIGGFDESLFIDYVDTEWCLRCAAAGIFIRIEPGVRMHHSLGSGSIALGPYRVPRHGPERRYYRLRNALLLLRYRHVPLRYSVREIAVSLFHQVILTAGQADWREQLAASFQGTADGVCGITGPRETARGKGLAKSV